MRFNTGLLLAFCLHILAMPPASFMFSRLPLTEREDVTLVEMAGFLANVALESRAGKLDECGKGLAGLFNDPINNNGLISAALYTGKKLNDLGDYRSCKNTSESRYLLANILTYRLGLCLPKQCTVQLMEPFKNSLAALINSVTRLKIEKKDINFVDVSEENGKLGKIGTGAIAFSVLTGFMISIIASATILDQYSVFTPKHTKEKPILKALQCFSVSRNIRAVLTAKNKVDPNLDIFNGIRFVAMLWIIYGHTYELDTNLAPVFNLSKFIQDILGDFNFSFIKVSTLAVDIFFFFSGFFSALAFYNALKKPGRRSIVRVLISYLHRYLRLFPLMLFSLLSLMYIVPSLKDQPFHSQIKNEIKSCEKNWLWTFLYANNIIDTDVCMGWTWYLMNDMQFYLVAPALVLPFLYSCTVGVLVLAGCCVVSITGTAMIYSHYGLHTSFAKPESDDYYTKFYVKPYCRIVPYLLGIFLFFLYQERKKQEATAYPPFKRIAKFVASRSYVKYVFYVLGLVLMYGSIHTIYFFDKYPNSWGLGLATLYELAFRPCFVIGLMLIIYPTLIGHGKLLLDVLGHPIFSPLGKLTYGAYMIHVLIIYTLIGYSMCGHFVNHSWLLFSMLTTLFLTYVGSFVVTVIFESPVLELLKTYLDPKEEVMESDEHTKKSLLSPDKEEIK